jgi:hypothetical protein
VQPTSLEAQRICREDLNEVITAFVQDKPAIERGLFGTEIVPEELTVQRMGKIVRDKYPDLSDQDQEAIRQRAVAALNITQQAKAAINPGNAIAPMGNTAFVDGVRKFVNVRELEIDLIDRINPFGEAYAILAKAMDEKRLTEIAAIINAKKANMTLDEARDLAKRGLKFKQERGRLPSITSPDAWEKLMAEGIAFLARKTAESRNG